MEHERDAPLEIVVAELRADVRHLGVGFVEVRQDIRRLDDRIFQLLLIQIATLVTALSSLVTVLVTAFAG